MVYAVEQADEYKLPVIWRPNQVEKFDLSGLEEDRGNKLKALLARCSTGSPFLDREDQTAYCNQHAYNISISKCFNCAEFAVWIYDRIVYPAAGEAPTPNPDLPPHIRADYDEASSILNLSPRGAAALLRLAIQKLCTHLGGKGKNINDDIKVLVSKGLDVKIQQALDIVRVVGNNAVHPGELDISDDRATAQTLFRLVNVIADKLISDPKHIAEMYSTLPEEARKAIEKRDQP